MKILVCDDLPEKGIALLRAIPGATVDVKKGLSEADLIKTVPAYEALVVRSATQITPKVIEAGKKLRAIVRAGMGYDNIDLDAATHKGVVVMNTPGSNSVTTAEHAIAMMMSLARNIPQAHGSLKEGKWEKKAFVGTELAGKTLGVVGLGNVGRLVAMRAKGLKMEVIGFDPFIPEKIALEAGAKPVSLEQIFTQADFITLHTTLTDETRHVINAAAIKEMKEGVRIINCARGGLIDETALFKALENGKVAGAALDVFEEEPPAKDHPLLKHPKVVVTPHLGASTAEAQEQVVVAAVEQLRLFAVEDIVINGVNVPSVSRDVLAALGPYLNLGSRLGSFLAQLGSPPVEQISIECAGEIVKYDTAPLGLSVLRGFLSHFASSSVNFVNAQLIAKERGIRVVESRSSDTGNYLSLITVRTRAKNVEHVVAGSVFGREHLRLVRVDNFYLEITPEGHIILIENEDKPGVVGAWGTALGKNKINISRMQVALDAQRGQALSIVNVDTPVSDPVIQELRKVTNIRSVRQIKL